MLEQLGFSLATPQAACPPAIARVNATISCNWAENLAAGLNGQSLFLFAGDQKDADAIYANPLLAHLPAVAANASPAGHRDLPP